MAIEGGDIVWALAIKTTEFENSLARAGDQADALKGRFQNTIGVLQGMGAAMTAVGGGIIATLGMSLKSYVETGSAIKDMSDRTGIAAETLSGLKFAAEQSGTSLETVEAAVRRMQLGITGSFEKSVEATEEWNNKIRESNEKLSKLQGQLETTLPGGKYDKIVKAIAEEQARLNDLMADGANQEGFADALNKIGVSFEHLKSLGPEQQFMQIAKAIGGVVDPTERAGLAMEIFGKSGTQLLPLIGSDMDALMAKARELGLVMDDEAASKAEAFGDTLDQLKGAFQGLMIAAGPIVVDVLVPFVQKAIEAVSAITQWTQAHPALTEALVVVGGAVGALMLALGPLLIFLPGLISAFTIAGPIIAGVGAVFAALVSPIGLLVAAIAAAVVAIVVYWDEIVAGVQWLWQRWLEGFQIGMNMLSAAWDGILDAINAGWDLVKAAWQMGVDFVVAVFETWIAWQQAKVGAVVAAFEWMGDGIAGVWAWIVGTIQSAADWIISIVQGVIGWIQEAINWVSQIPGNVAQTLGFWQGGVVPGFAQGGVVQQFAEGGTVAPVIVGERGPELAFLPTGTRVVSHGESRDAIDGARGDVVINMGGSTINAGAFTGNPREVAERIYREMKPALVADFTRSLERAQASF